MEKHIATFTKEETKDAKGERQVSKDDLLDWKKALNELHVKKGGTKKAFRNKLKRGVGGWFCDILNDGKWYEVVHTEDDTKKRNEETFKKHVLDKVNINASTLTIYMNCYKNDIKEGGVSAEIILRAVIFFEFYAAEFEGYRNEPEHCLEKILGKVYLQGLEENQKRSRILILGVHDDMEFCKSPIEEALEEALKDDYTIDWIDYESLNKPHEVVENIQRKINSSQPSYDGYVIVYGYSYGPELEINHLKTNSSKRNHELIEASLCRSRGSRIIPTLIYTADIGSELAKAIESKYEKLLLEQYGSDLKLIDLDKHNLRSFKRQIEFEASANTLSTYRTDIRRMEELWIYITHDLKGSIETPKRFKSEQVVNPVKDGSPFKSSPLEAKFFEISKPETIPIWQQQKDQAKKIYREFTKDSKKSVLPGICILIHGINDTDINGLANYLVQSECWPVEKPLILELDEMKAFPEQEIWDLLWSDFGHPPDEVDSKKPSKLAKEIVNCKRPVMLLLKCLDRAKKLNLVNFIENIWKPLHNELKLILARDEPNSKRYLFLNIVVTWQGQLSSYQKKQLSNNDKKDDYEHFVLVDEVSSKTTD